MNYEKEELADPFLFVLKLKEENRKLKKSMDKDKKSILDKLNQASLGETNGHSVYRKRLMDEIKDYLNDECPEGCECLKCQ
jgi:hypothetical protein